MKSSIQEHSIYRLFYSFTSQEDRTLLTKLTPFVITIFLVIYSTLLFTSGYCFLLFLAIGFSLGSINKQKEHKIPQEHYYVPLQLEQEEEECSSISETLQLFYPPLTATVNRLLDYVMRDFVSSWWQPLNFYNDTTFEKLARQSINTMLLNLQRILLKQERNDLVMSTLYGVANTLIIHMRECRSLEESQLSTEEYILQNPQSPFAQLFSKEEQHRQLKALSHLFLTKTLSPADKSSRLQMNLLGEILATHVLGNMLDSFSDPDFLNCWIIHLLQSSTHNDTALTDESIAQDLTIATATMDDDDTNSTMTTTSLTRTSEDTSPNTPPQRESDILFDDSPIRSLENALSLRSSVTESSLKRGRLSFSIMDISAPPHGTNINDQPLNKEDLAYIIQIEQPAVEDDHAGSEGGGYVITRTYSDFETFHDILRARHIQRISKIQLKLPLDTAHTLPSSSWLTKTGTNQQRKTKRMSLDSISSQLEHYIHTVVKDDELSTDSIVVLFLRKEKHTGAMTSFSKEFEDEAIAARNYSSSVSTPPLTRSFSLFSRNNTSNNTIAIEESSEGHQEPNSNRWFTLSKSKTTRSGPVSNIVMQSTKELTIEKEETEPTAEILEDSTLFSTASDRILVPDKINVEEIAMTNKPMAKSLSTTDVELLIETTYALVVEIFNLTASNSNNNNKAWMRRSILNLLREIVRRSYVDFISEQYTDFINAYMSPDAMVNVLNKLGESFWPEARPWVTQHADSCRTEVEKQTSKALARNVLTSKEVIPNTVRQLMGDQNCYLAMDRIWSRLQDPDLNRVLVLQLLERFIKPVLG